MCRRSKYTRPRHKLQLFPSVSLCLPLYTIHLRFTSFTFQPPSIAADLLEATKRAEETKNKAEASRKAQRSKLFAATKIYKKPKEVFVPKVRPCTYRYIVVPRVKKAVGWSTTYLWATVPGCQLGYILRYG